MFGALLSFRSLRLTVAFSAHDFVKGSPSVFSGDVQ